MTWKQLALIVVIRTSSYGIFNSKSFKTIVNFKADISSNILVFLCPDHCWFKAPRTTYVCIEFNCCSSGGFVVRFIHVNSTSAETLINKKVEDLGPRITLV